ncbi:MAG: hypothetical protein ACOY90_16480 [Candidatus Zhuqueibacterota bacterium]
MQKMYFDARDIFRSTRIALSLQRIWLQFVGLAIGYLGYLMLTYISFMTAGLELVGVWKKHGLLPCIFSEPHTWIATMVYSIGVLWLLVVYLIATTAVARATYMTSKGNHFYTWRDALKFSFRKISSIILSPMAILILIGLFVSGGAVVGWLGKIPFIGEFGITIFTLFWFIASLLIVFFGIVLIVALIQAPAILATTDDDAFEVVFQSFSLVWAQPWRLILYEAISAVMAVVGFVVLATISKNAYIVMDRIFSNTMGEDFINISAQGMYILSVWLTHSMNWVHSAFHDISDMFYFSREYDPLQLAIGYHYAASYIFALWMLFIGGLILSYGIASFNVGNTLTYLVLRKKKDDENLLERKDKEEEEDEEEESSEEKKEGNADESKGTTEDEEKEEA